MSRPSCVRCPAESAYTVYPERHFCEPCGEAFDVELEVRLEARREAREAARRTPKVVEVEAPLFTPAGPARPLHAHWSWEPTPGLGVGPARDGWGVRTVEAAYHGGLVLHRQRQLGKKAGKVYWLGDDRANTFDSYAALVAEVNRRLW